MKGRELGEATRQLDLAMMQICLDLARQASLQGEVPVGALVARGGTVLSRGHNLVEQSHDPTAHAERLVIAEACQIRRSRYLGGCTLYATLEPCPMCAGAILLGRVDRVVYGAADSKAGACRSLYRLTDDLRLNHQVQVMSGVLEEACAQILTRFFQDRR